MRFVFTMSVCPDSCIRTEWSSVMQAVDGGTTWARRRIVVDASALLGLKMRGKTGPADRSCLPVQCLSILKF